MSVRATTNLRVQVTCDACECEYHYDLPVSGQAMLRENSARRDLAQHIESRIRDNNLPCPDAPYYKECPECGFIPDWMVRSAARRKAKQMAAIIVVLALLGWMGMTAGSQMLGDNVLQPLKMIPICIAGACVATIFIGAPLALLLVPRSAARQIEEARSRWFATHPRPARTHTPIATVVRT